MDSDGRSLRGEFTRTRVRIVFLNTLVPCLPLLLKQLLVLVGSIRVLVGHSESDDGVGLPIRRFFLHPEYRTLGRFDFFWTYLNDIALIQLENPLRYSSSIQPVCLPEPQHDDNSFSRCYITGWGSYDGGG